MSNKLIVVRLSQAAVLVIMLGGAAVVRASVANVFEAGKPVSAREMNDNFSALDARLAKLEAVKPKAYCSATFTASPGQCTVVSGSDCVQSCTYVAISGGGGAVFNFVAGRFTSAPTCVASPASVDGTWLSTAGDSAVSGSVRFGPTSNIGVSVVCVAP